MNRFYLRLALLLLTSSTAGVTAAPPPYNLLHSLFSSSTNLRTHASQGHAVAVDGTFAVVGAPYDQASAGDKGAVRVYDTQTRALLHLIVNPITNLAAREGNFGWSVAMSGSRMVVGSPSPRPGLAYVYDLAGATPSAHVVMLANSFPDEGFASAVAISGTHVLIGVPAADAFGVTDAGLARVYDLASPMPYQPILTLTNPIPSQSRGFGSDVAISGAYMAVRANSFTHVYELHDSAPASHVIALADNGEALAISGTRIVIGASREGSSQIRRVNVYDLTSATPGVPVIVIPNPNPSGTDAFGGQVALSGARLVVSSPGRSRAYVYDLDSATPAIPILALDNTDPSSWNYGASVAISGRSVLVGATMDDLHSGQAYLFDLGGSRPNVPVFKFKDQGLSIRDLFGRSVAITGTRMIVGAPRDNVGGWLSGAVYVYELAGATPAAPIMTLTDPVPGNGAQFGDSVAASGTRVAVGAIGDNTGAIFGGSVHVFDLASASPTRPVSTLTNPSPEVGDYFGQTLAISGTRIVVGDYRDDSRAPDAGVAYVYDLASPSPAVPQIVLTNPSPTQYDYFGSAVAISGTRVVIGSPYDDQGAGNAGLVYIYDLAGATPAVPAITLTNPAPSFYEAFGMSVAISDLRVVVGSSSESDGLLDGHAYVYDLASARPAVPLIILTNPVPRDRDGFGSGVAISGTRIVVRASWDATGAANAGSVYVYDLGSTTPSIPLAFLNNPSPSLDDYFGGAFALDGAFVVVGVFNDDTVALDRGAAYVFGPAPSLSLVPAAPGFAMLSWTPPTSSGFVLQYADTLSPTNWLNAPSGAANPISIPTANTSRFYRLFQP